LKISEKNKSRRRGKKINALLLECPGRYGGGWGVHTGTGMIGQNP
jgi:hypothetical protein